MRGLMSLEDVLSIGWVIVDHLPDARSSWPEYLDPLRLILGGLSTSLLSEWTTAHLGSLPSTARNESPVSISIQENLGRSRFIRGAEGRSGSCGRAGSTGCNKELLAETCQPKFAGVLGWQAGEGAVRRRMHCWATRLSRTDGVTDSPVKRPWCALRTAGIQSQHKAVVSMRIAIVGPVGKRVGEKIQALV
jgi:hypothetical protein